MIKKIQKSRDKLRKIVEKYGIHHRKTYKESKKLDKLLKKLKK